MRSTVAMRFEIHLENVAYITSLKYIMHITLINVYKETCFPIIVPYLAHVCIYINIYLCVYAYIHILVYFRLIASQGHCKD